MASTTFVDYSTPIVATWLNDVDDMTYRIAAQGRGVSSTTTQTIGTGSRSFNVDRAAPFTINTPVLIYGSTGAYMSGYVTSWDAATKFLNVMVTQAVGSGTFSSWSLTQSMGFFSVQGLSGTGIAMAVQPDGPGVGIGVLPPAWGLSNAGGALSLRGVGSLGAASMWGGNLSASFGSNVYMSASGATYNSSGFAQYFTYNSTGGLDFYTAPSGVKDAAATFTKVAAMDVNGRAVFGSGTFSGPATLQTSGALKTGGFTVATLPASPTIGTRTYVTNALGPVYLATVVGGGAVTVPVFYNGTSWIVA